MGWCLVPALDDYSCALYIADRHAKNMVGSHRCLRMERSDLSLRRAVGPSLGWRRHGGRVVRRSDQLPSRNVRNGLASA